MAKKYKSDIARSAHATITSLHHIGVASDIMMREFDAMCLTPVLNLQPNDVKQLCERGSQ